MRRIKITKCDSKDYWYKDKIGEEFLISNRAHKFGYKVIANKLAVDIVRFSDCKLIEEKVTHKMSISEIKKRMIKYRDMFGGELLEVGRVNDCVTREELREIIDSHNDHMEMMLNDAQSSLERFSKRIGLKDI